MKIYIDWFDLKGIPTGRCINSSVEKDVKVCEVSLKSSNHLPKLLKILTFLIFRLEDGARLNMNHSGKKTQ